MTWKDLKAFVRTTRPSFYALLLKYNVLTREITSLTCSSSHDELNSIAQELFGAIIQLQPLPGDDPHVCAVDDSVTKLIVG